jgi:ATP-dependent RNA helicase SUPV3L1/SUV3
MLERLADMLRNKDTRGGFEASADMLSITGLTLDQFADLMAGLGYRGERGERPKVKPAPVAPAVAQDAAGDPSDIPTEIPGDTPAEMPVAPPTETPVETPVEQPIEQPDEAPPSPPEEAPDEQPGEQAAAVETEVFYTFTWAPRRQGNGPRTQQRRAEGDKPREERAKPRFDGADKPRGKGGKGGKPPRGKGPKPPREESPKTFSSRPEKRDRIDPDNPFAQALAGLKGKS